MTICPVWILLSAIVLNLKIPFPFTVKALFVSLYSGCILYNFSSTSAKVSLGRQFIPQIKEWSSEINWMTLIWLKSTNLGWLLFKFSIFNYIF